jgi:hypothetical protein
MIELRSLELPFRHDSDGLRPDFEGATRDG